MVSLGYIISMKATVSDMFNVLGRVQHLYFWVTGDFKSWHQTKNYLICKLLRIAINILQEHFPESRMLHTYFATRCMIQLQCFEHKC